MLNIRERRKAIALREIQELVGELGITQTLAVLDVYGSTVKRWIEGKSRPSAAVYIALKAAARGQLPGMEIRQWQGWRFLPDGRLWNPNGADSYGPADLLGIHWKNGQIEALERRIKELELVIERLSRPGPPAANDAADLRLAIR